jgi:hypothetical protein
LISGISQSKTWIFFWLRLGGIKNLLINLSRDLGNPRNQCVKKKNRCTISVPLKENGEIWLASVDCS